VVEEGKLGGIRERLDRAGVDVQEAQRIRDQHRRAHDCAAQAAARAWDRVATFKQQKAEDLTAEEAAVRAGRSFTVDVAAHDAQIAAAEREARTLDRVAAELAVPLAEDDGNVADAEAKKSELTFYHTEARLYVAAVPVVENLVSVVARALE